MVWREVELTLTDQGVDRKVVRDVEAGETVELFSHQSSDVKASVIDPDRVSVIVNNNLINAGTVSVNEFGSLIIGDLVTGNPVGRDYFRQSVCYHGDVGKVVDQKEEKIKVLEWSEK